MSLRQQLELADNRLRSIYVEQLDQFEFAASIVARARELALQHGQAKAAKLARVGEDISPAEGREIIAAMLATLPTTSDLLTIKQAAELANVSERQLYRLSHLHTRVGKAIRIRRADLRDLGTEFD